MANGNQFSVNVPSLYEALLAGEAGYKGVREQQSQRAVQDARRDAQGAMLNGGDTRGAMARLIGAGDMQGATAISNMTGAESDREWRRAEAERTQRNADRNYDLAAAQAARRDAPAFGEIYDANGQQQKALIDARYGSYTPIGGVKAKSKELPFGVIKELGDRGGTFGDFSRLTETFTDTYGGYKLERAGDVANWTARNLGMGDQAGAQWWQDYQNQKNLVRNQLFGSALTTTEKAEFDKANINPGMTPQAIRDNLTRQHAATQRAAAKLANVYVQMGYGPEQIEAALGVPLQALGIGPRSGGAPQPGGMPGGMPGGAPGGMPRGAPQPAPGGGAPGRGGGAPGRGGAVQPPRAAIQLLQSNATPQMRAFFDEQYGPGSAAAVLGR
jgi:hypothetical protein